MNVRARARLHFHQAYDPADIIHVWCVLNQVIVADVVLFTIPWQENWETLARKAPFLSWVKKILHWIRWHYVVYDASTYIHMSQNISFRTVLEIRVYLWKMQPRRTTAGYHRPENSSFSSSPVRAMIPSERSISTAKRRAIYSSTKNILSREIERDGGEFLVNNLIDPRRAVVVRGSTAELLPVWISRSRRNSPAERRMGTISG